MYWVFTARGIYADPYYCWMRFTMALLRLHHWKPIYFSKGIPRMSSSARSSPLLALIDEEQSPNYNPQRYYPGQIGKPVGRYRLLSKLGWGASSTAWLAEDFSRWPWQRTRYVTLKIANCGIEETKAAEEEVAISKHISTSRSDHQGMRYIRLVRESFQVEGQFGSHVCLVFEPLREPIWRLGRHLGSIGVPPVVLKPFLRVLLEGLDFLHSECGIIHTDLKADNLLVAFEDATVIPDYVRQQTLDPPVNVFRHGRPVWQSRPDFGPLKKGTGLLKISDFSAAVSGNVPRAHTHDIQPLPFCAPEVLLKAGWTYSADIWNLGTMLWELLADATLLNGRRHPDAEYSREVHIAQMIRLLGKPPSCFLESRDPSIRGGLFSPEGDSLFPDLIPSADFNFENLTPFLCGEEQRLFIEFALRMLQWEPERRATAKELLQDPWLHC